MSPIGGADYFPRQIKISVLSLLILTCPPAAKFKSPSVSLSSPPQTQSLPLFIFNPIVLPLDGF
jgi:hypothetical protein